MPSSAIADIEYDPERERLTVTFVTGRIYEYVDVPSEVAASFRSAFAKRNLLLLLHQGSLRFPRAHALSL